jgi:hypothetical protein
MRGRTDGLASAYNYLAPKNCNSELFSRLKYDPCQLAWPVKEIEGY